MALRDKLRDRVQPLLEPGEQIEEVFLAQTGPSPWLGLLTYLVLFAVKRRIVAVTNRGIVMIRSGAWSGTSAKEVLGRLPRSTTIGPLSGLWAKAHIGPEKVYIHKRFHSDVARADAGAVGASPRATGSFPPPG